MVKTSQLCVPPTPCPCPCPPPGSCNPEHPDNITHCLRKSKRQEKKKSTARSRNDKDLLFPKILMCILDLLLQPQMPRILWQGGPSVE